MNNFSKAHKMTKAIIQAGDNYAATFALCLKAVYAESKAPAKKVDMMDVYKAMVDAVENGNYVYLDNIDLDALGINSVQFSGYCSALARCGLYLPANSCFGQVIF